jgi:phosphatidylserine decarboxylase
MNNYILHAPEFIFILAILLALQFIYKFNISVYICIYVIFILYFFRGWKNPYTELDETNIYCPCEGKVMDIEEIDNTYHIAIFLNVHNIHVQYSPVKGIIKSIVHKHGTFVPAYFFEKSKFNERIETIIDTDIGDIKFVQIAGQLAQRIKTFKKEGSSINQLEPIGLIKFGSRCDLYLPKDKTNVVIKKDQYVKIGDILAVKL